MRGSLLICAIFAAGAAPAEEAPAPRAARPELSLIVIENLSSDEGIVVKRRVVRIGVSRGGKLFPSETVWEGDQRFLGHFGGHQLANDRYLVTNFGGVIDLRDGKVLNDVESGQLCRIDGKKVLYWSTNGRDQRCVMSFDLDTGKTQTAATFPELRWSSGCVLSPDGLAALEALPVADELILHQLGAKPKLLGKGFRIDIGELSSTFGPTPVLWLNPGLILTQRGNGKLVTVDLTGKVTELLTIKDAPKDLAGPPHFFRDGSNRIVYLCGGGTYTIDVDKKEWAKSEWQDLGHGFEASWDRHAKLGHKLRHHGKDIGPLVCWPHTARTAPRLLALEASYQQDTFVQPECIAVYSTASGTWQTHKMWPNSVVGWVK
jgi:hypothetical protein